MNRSGRNLPSLRNSWPELGRYLEDSLKESPCDHTRAKTEKWLREQAVSNVKRTMDAMRNHGGYCDCEVLANVVQG